MTFLLIMRSRSYLRNAICSFIANEIDHVEILAVDSAEEASLLSAEQLAAVSLILMHCRNDFRDHHDLTEDIATMRGLLSAAPVVLLGDGTESHGTEKAFRLGAKGFIPETTPAEIVKHALPLVAVGGVFLPSANESLAASQIPRPLEKKENHARPMMHQSPVTRNATDVPTNEFTEREIEVLMLLGNGLQNKLIAYELGVKESTVKVHVRHIMKKLKATSRTQAALFAQRCFSHEDDNLLSPAGSAGDEA